MGYRSRDIAHMQWRFAQWRFAQDRQKLWSSTSRKLLEIAAWSRWNTNSILGTESRMVTWPMTSRDLERSRSWPNYLYDPLSPKGLEIWGWSQWPNRKWGTGSRTVTWWMTSRDLEKSKTWPNFLGPISPKKGSR